MFSYGNERENMEIRSNVFRNLCRTKVNSTKCEEICKRKKTLEERKKVYMLSSESTPRVKTTTRRWLA